MLRTERNFSSALSKVVRGILGQLICCHLISQNHIQLYLSRNAYTVRRQSDLRLETDYLDIKSFVLMSCIKMIIRIIKEK